MVEGYNVLLRRGIMSEETAQTKGSFHVLCVFVLKNPHAQVVCLQVIAKAFERLSLFEFLRLDQPVEIALLFQSFPPLSCSKSDLCQRSGAHMLDPIS